MTPEASDAIPDDPMSIAQLYDAAPKVEDAPAKQRCPLAPDGPDPFHFHEEGHLYYSDQFDEIPLPGISSLLRDYGHAEPLNDFQQQAAEKGRRVHLWLEIIDKGEEVENKPSAYAQAFIDQWKRACEYIGVLPGRDGWHAIETPNYIRAETPCGPFAYAGRCDRVAILTNGDTALIEIKTTTGHRDKNHRLQLELQRRVWPCEHKICVYLTGKPDWKPADWIDEYAEKSDREEVDRMLAWFAAKDASARWRANRTKRKPWVRREPVPAGKTPI